MRRRQKRRSYKLAGGYGQTGTMSRGQAVKVARRYSRQVPMRYLDAWHVLGFDKDDYYRKYEK